MARMRFMAVALLALAFAGSSIPVGRTQTGVSDDLPTTEPKPAADGSCVIYSLTDMGYDVHLGVWIAETVPEMIEPSSWKAQGGTGAIRYYAPKNILIVKQTKAIQKKVDGFLKDLKTSMPKVSAAKTPGKRTSHAGVTVADYREPAPSNPASEPSSYPVPAAVKPPKHLFHFIIRYEGDGIIDDNVVKFMKSQLQGGKPLLSVTSQSPSPSALPAPPAVSDAPGVNAASPLTSSPPYASPSGSYAAPPAYGGSPTPTTAASEQPSAAPNKKKRKQSPGDAPVVR